MRQLAWFIAVGIAAATVPSLPALAQQTEPGIDCSKARSPVEKAICANPPLIALDRQTAMAFGDALARQPDQRDPLRQEQLRWLRQRDTACAVPAPSLVACLRAQLTARIAALTPPPGPVIAGPAPAATQLDAPIARTPDPAIPATPMPQAAATLDQASLPAAEQAETLLHVTTAGRFKLTVTSQGGAALQLVDMLTGPGDVAGAAGSQDGRLDPMLDVGVYKLRVFSAKGATGSTALHVEPFRDAAPPAALPQPGQPLATTLADGEQRAFWLSVPNSGTVRIEAAGRALADLRLWRNGRELSALEPAVTPIEPAPGHPLTDIRLTGQVEPGTYLVVAYGGRAATWTDNDASQPFHLRSGASDALTRAWGGGAMGPFGSEIYRLPATTALLRLQLPQPAAAELLAGDASASIARDSREPVASLAVAPGTQDVVEVRAAAGQRFTLRALDLVSAQTVEKPGTYWVSATAAGAGGDEVPPTLLLERVDNSGQPPRIIADTLPVLGPDAGWHTQFNLRGPTMLLARSEGGQVVVRTSGVPVQGRRVESDLPAGFYALALAPQTGALGAVDVVLGPPGINPSLSPKLPPDPVLPFGVQSVRPGEQLRLSGGTAPGLSLGLSARPVPVALVEGPLSVTLSALASTDIPIQLAPGGVLSVTEIGRGPVPYAIRQEAGRTLVTLPPADHARTAVLAWQRNAPPPAPIPAPPPLGSEAELQAGTPVFFDLAADQLRSFGLTVAQGGLYRVETLGRLHTAGLLSTPFIPHLAEAEANGIGQNMLMQTSLRAGRYRVQVSAKESVGHAGLSATPAPLLPLATLRPGGSVRATLQAGAGASIPLIVDAADTLRLDVASLGAPFLGRLEDGEGWPLTRPGKLDGFEQSMTPGRDRLLIEPSAVTREVVVRLNAVARPAPITGHGPHPLPFGAAQSATWREPESQSAPRTPDRWTFALQGTAQISLRLGDAMIGELRRDGAADPPPRIVGQWQGTLQAGRYALDVTSLGRNDRAAYTLTLDSDELQPDSPRSVTLPATLPFAIAAPRVVSLTSFGSTPVKAVLRDSDGHVVGRYAAREDDWNIAVSRPLPAGAYTLELAPAAAPESTDTTLRDAPPSADDSTRDNSNDNDPAASTDQDAQTAASQAADAPVSTPAPSSNDDADAPAPQVEVRLSLPPALAPAPAPTSAATLSGQGVHELSVAQPPPGSLLVVQAQSAAELVLVLERRGSSGWQTVALDQGRAPSVASPADEQAAPWRARVWAVDGGPDPVRFAARPVTAAAQEPGRVDLTAIEAMPAPLALAKVAIPPGLAALAAVPAGTRQGSWPGHGLMAAAANTVLPASGDLWLLGSAGTAQVTPLSPQAGQSVALTLPAGLTATLPSGGATQLWLARAGAGQPSLGPAMGWAPGSAIALAGSPVPLRGGTDADALPVDLQRVDLHAAAARTVDSALHIMLPASGALPVTLPPGHKRLQLELAAETGAIPGWHGPATAIWAGGEAATRSVEGDWTEILLLNTASAPAPVSIAIAPVAAEPALAPGHVMKRFFGAAGSFEQAVQGGDGASVHLSGPGTLTVIDSQGGVSTGADLALPGPGRAIVQHGSGALALWIEAPGAPPWPVATPQKLETPAQTALSGPAAAFSLEFDRPMLLHASTTAPVLLGLKQPGQDDRPALFPAGAEVHRMVAAGAAELHFYPPQDGSLTGTLFLRAEPILPAEEGLGTAVAVPPGGAAAFGFTLAQAATIGIGIRADPDRATARLLDANGRVVGQGIAQLVALKPGSYVLEAQVPQDAPTTMLRPALVGITPRNNGPPPDVVRDYLELAGMKPQGATP